MMNSKQIAKRIALTIAWFLLVLFVVTILIGCATKPYQRPDCPYGDPLPPKKLHDLLYHPDEQWAYKSITIKEIIGEKDFN